MLRDYFYDPNLHNIDWDAVFTRYEPLVAKCAKREDLDDVLGQMAAELSALHVFVYGGEYDDPVPSQALKNVHLLGSLGADFQRNEELNGYEVLDVYDGDVDYTKVEDSVVYATLGEMFLKRSGQKGLKKGDVVHRVNGENVMEVGDWNVLLRGM